MPRPAYLVALCAALALANVAQLVRPPKVHEVVRTEVRDTASTTATASVDKGRRAAARELVRTVVTKPDGTRIERDHISEVAKAWNDAATSTQTTEVEHVETHEAEKTVTASSPGFRLTLGADVGVQPLDLSPRLYVSASARVFGPLWLDASFVPPVLGHPSALRAGASIAFEW